MEEEKRSSLYLIGLFLHYLLSVFLPDMEIKSFYLFQLDPDLFGPAFGLGGLSARHLENGIVSGLTQLVFILAPHARGFLLKKWTKYT